MTIVVAMFILAFELISRSVMKALNIENVPRTATLEVLLKRFFIHLEGYSRIQGPKIKPRKRHRRD